MGENMFIQTQGTFNSNGSVIGNSFLTAIDEEVQNRIAQTNALAAAKAEAQAKAKALADAQAQAQAQAQADTNTSAEQQTSFTEKVLGYAAAVKAKFQEFQIPKSADQLRTNLSDFYNSFNINKYVNTQKLKQNATASFCTAKVSSMGVIGRLVSYSSSFLNTMQELYSQVVAKYSNPAK